MAFGISQLWALLALAGAVQLYLLWRMLKQADFGKPGRKPTPIDDARAPQSTVPNPPARRTVRPSFGKRMPSAQP